MLKYSDVSHQNDTIFAMSYEQMQLLFVQNTTSKFLFTIKVPLLLQNITFSLKICDKLCYIPYETYSLVFHLKASLSVQNIILKTSHRNITLFDSKLVTQKKHQTFFLTKNITFRRKYHLLSC